MPKASAGENADAVSADLSAASVMAVGDKVVVITGGGSGIGAMMASGFVQNGGRVYIASRKDTSAFAAELTARGPGTCTALRADLQDQAALEATAKAVGEREGRVDVLVNNAGTNYNAPIEESDGRAFSKVLDVNLACVFQSVQAFLPLLRAAAAPARIINVSSINGIDPPGMMDTYAYSSSKAGVLMLTRHLAARLAPDVLVNAICPGPFRSRMMRATLAGEGEAMTVASTLLKRLGAPADAFGAALLLSSPAGAYITGAALPVDGGMLLSRM